MGFFNDYGEQIAAMRVVVDRLALNDAIRKNDDERRRSEEGLLRNLRQNLQSTHSLVVGLQSADKAMNARLREVEAQLNRIIGELSAGRVPSLTVNQTNASGDGAQLNQSAGKDSAVGDFNFSNNVTGGSAQINQGQNVTATQTNTGDHNYTFADAREKAAEELPGGGVPYDETIAGIDYFETFTTEAVAEPEKTYPDGFQGFMEKAFDTMKRHAPAAAEIALDVALEAVPLGGAAKAALRGIREKFMSPDAA